MGEVDKVERLLSARNLLKTSLEKSKDLGLQLEKTGPKLEKIRGRLYSMEATIGPIPMNKCSLSAIKDQIECAVYPVAAILKVLNTLHELENLLLVLDPCSDIFRYVSVMKQLEEAIPFLGNNCRLVIEWLDGIVEALEDNTGVDDRCISNVKMSIGKIKQLQDANVNGGKVLFEALEKLEGEFKRIVTENRHLEEDCIDKLRVIIERFRGHDRIENCLSVYIEARVLNIRGILEDLDLWFLEKQVTDIDDLDNVEGVVEKWCKDIEFMVKQVFKPEYELCNEVFVGENPDIRMSCFVKIAIKCGIISFLQFGRSITDSKKNPIKLLKLLDIFATFDNLRMDFNRLFRHKACAKIQGVIRDFINGVVNGICVIFFELPLQVRFQREISPLCNGTVPKLVSFVTEFCNKILGENYRKILTQVLEIRQSWKQEKFQDEIFTGNVYNIIKEIALNLDEWSNSLKDITFSCFFMMNNHCHFSNQRGTKLGDFMGESWIQAHEQYRDYYLGLYIRESWGKLFSILNPDMVNFSPSGQNMNAREMKENLKAFNESFNHVYKNHSSWVVADKRMREKIRHILVKAFVPVYESYLVNFYVEIGQDVNASRYVKYSVDNLEEMLSSLFEPKLMNYGSSRSQFDSIDKIKNVFTKRLNFMMTQL